jgi:hypothetical protein
MEVEGGTPTSLSQSGCDLAAAPANAGWTVGGVCALSALCAIRAGFGRVGAGFLVLYFGPKGGGPSSAGGDSRFDKAETL